MKSKKIIILKSLTLIVLVGAMLIGFYLKNQENNKKSLEKTPITIEELKENEIRLNGEIVDITTKNIIEDSGGIVEYLYSNEFEELIKVSDALVRGRVKSVSYETLNGAAYAKLEFYIDDVYKGNINVSDTITIYYRTGYIELNEHIKYHNDAKMYSKLSKKKKANTLIKEYYSGETEFVKAGDDLILCLVKTKDDTDILKDYYQRLYPAGMLKLEGNTYKQKYGDVDEKYSINTDELYVLKELTKK